jgi:hypothetical protein
MVELIESRLRTLAPLEVKAPEFGGERTKTDKYELM